MAGYIIAMDWEITDEALFAEFRERVVPSAAAFGGTYLAEVSGLEVETITGEAPARAVVVHFGDVEQIRAWLVSPDYAELADMRDRSARYSMVVVEGSDPA